MRKIEQQMVNAVNNRDTWKGGNTEVSWNVNDSEGQLVGQVHLHGHLIAWLEQHEDEIPRISLAYNLYTRPIQGQGKAPAF